MDGGWIGSMAWFRANLGGSDGLLVRGAVALWDASATSETVVGMERLLEASAAVSGLLFSLSGLEAATILRDSSI
jgi:hypothetical protein